MNWRNDFLDRINNAKSEDQVMEAAVEIVRMEGFDYCAFGVQSNVSLTKPKTGLFNNYPKRWQERYLSQGYITSDPTVRHALTSSTPLVWGDELFAQSIDLWEDARMHGISAGWGMPTRGQGETVGLLSCSRAGEAIKQNELDTFELKLIYLANLVHVAICVHWIPRNLPEFECRLSPREQEILLWTAEGKTTTEAAKILGISERTAQFHLYNLMERLNVHNKSQLVMKAAMLGFLRGM